jgi:hypothetical protein
VPINRRCRESTRGTGSYVRDARSIDLSDLNAGASGDRLGDAAQQRPNLRRRMVRDGDVVDPPLLGCAKEVHERETVSGVVDGDT